MQHQLQERKFHRRLPERVSGSIISFKHESNVIYMQKILKLENMLFF